MKSLPKKSHREEIMAVWRRAYVFIRKAIRELQRSGRARKFRESFLAFLASGMVFLDIPLVGLWPSS